MSTSHAQFVVVILLPFRIRFDARQKLDQKIELVRGSQHLVIPIDDWQAGASRYVKYQELRIAEY
jgi:hypothetical protein